MKTKPQTMLEEMEELREAIVTFCFLAVKSLGLFQLIERIPFLKLKPWVKERL